ncbi:HAD family hydrolase [uncultured Capnocytophaga sp.]|uniref:HAD family hydrolase n=1 Tax=uncultured Capnocytophaga sp. TaxID=159273 RepID=UPI0028E7B84E|nr:HAD family hydrolase [uncultured Capnocytophaga sp.]
MSYKILFSDIDGTLLDAQRTLSEKTIKVLSELKDRLPIVLVSSRMPVQMYYLQEKAGILRMPLIAYNGALVLDGEKQLHSVEIPITLCEEIVAMNHQYAEGKVHISFYNYNEWYVPQTDAWAEREERNTCTKPVVKPNEEVISLWKAQNKGAHKLMLMGEEHFIEKMWQLLQEKMSGQLQLYRAKNTYIEITLQGISKLTGINVFLAHHPDITLAEAIAFGDNYNDQEMLEAVGLGVAVANAREEVKAIANATTHHHKEDGVALYLSELFQIEL